MRETIWKLRDAIAWIFVVCWLIWFVLFAWEAYAFSTQTIHWFQPAGSAPVTEFRAYVHQIAYDPAAVLIWSGLPEPDELGLYSAEITLTVPPPVHLWLTAANESGESQPSNASGIGCDFCDCDFDGDGVIGTPDLAVIGLNWGKSVTACTTGDCTGDARVGGADYAKFGQGLGQPVCVP